MQFKMTLRTSSRPLIEYHLMNKIGSLLLTLELSWEEQKKLSSLLIQSKLKVILRNGFVDSKWK